MEEEGEGAVSKVTDSRIYASLSIAWDGELQDALSHLKNYGVRFDEYVDNHALPRRVLLEKLTKKGLRSKAFRHNWFISSNQRVKGRSLDLHLAWLFKHVKPKIRLSSLAAKGFRVQLTCFFETGDFGGGPVVTPEIAALIAFHQVDLKFDIYPLTASGSAALK